MRNQTSRYGCENQTRYTCWLECSKCKEETSHKRKTPMNPKKFSKGALNHFRIPVKVSERVEEAHTTMGKRNSKHLPHIYKGSREHSPTAQAACKMYQPGGYDCLQPRGTHDGGADDRSNNLRVLCERNLSHNTHPKGS